ncbi:MAG: hypothetical protein SPL03_08055, partial [Succinivibrio dextrinosolvens]|nr:hypothetical protein [Succinivibrio dextrinosolvens]
DTLGYVSDVLFYSRYGVHGMFNDMLKFSSDYSFDVADYLDGKAAESVNKVKEMVSDVKQMFSSENKEQSTKHDLNESRVVSKKNIDTNNNRSKSYKR